MYIPKHFQLNNLDTCLKMILENPFAHLSIVSENGLESHSIPLLAQNIQHLEVDESTIPEAQIPISGQFIGHIARTNDLWKRLENGSDCMVHFPVTDSYITPSWYEEKRLSGKVVPTWNYVHIYAWGRISFITEQDKLLDIVTQLTDHMESSLDTPWKVTDAPDRYIETMLRGIIGVEISLSKFAGKAKLNQNHPLHNRVGLAKGLSEQGHEMAQWINVQPDNEGLT